MSLSRYPSYAQTSLQWAESLPEHWGVKPLKRNVELLTEKTDSNECPVGLENLEGWTGRFIETESDFQGEGVGFEANDILFGKLRPYLAKVWLADRKGEAVGDFHVLHPLSGSVPRFVQYQLLTREVIDLVNGSTYGAKMPRASWDFLGSLEMPTPSEKEQTAIATFLDRETAKIDALIAEQQRLIELLQEKRQAVISHAVTKGLNPNAPMKDSGVEWLGEVPEHWTVCSFRRFIRIAEGQVDPREDPYAQMPLIAPNHIEPRTGLLTCLETAQEQGAESGKYLCDAGDVIYSKIRPALQKACIAPEGCLTSADMYPLKTSERLSPDFLLFFLLSEQFSALAVMESERVAMPKVNRDTLGAIPLAIPPRAEQDNICHYISEVTSGIYELVNKATISIQLMQERRSALISAAVTGQIDVRGLVPEAAEQ